MAHDISIDEIEATSRTQVRSELDKKVIADYAEAMQAGAIFPALTVFAEKDSQRFILADGFHRLEAAKAQRLVSFQCEVQTGGIRAALSHALGANDQHGLRRTNADKRNAVELALMKSSAYLIVTSRGRLVDHAALVDALRTKRIAGAGLDVVVEEPLPPDNELWELENVVITPHIAGNSPELDERTFRIFEDNLQRYVTGQPLQNVVDKQRQY